MQTREVGIPNYFFSFLFLAACAKGMNWSPPLPQLHHPASPRSCSHERLEWREAAQTGTACHQAHLDQEGHGGDLPGWLRPAQPLLQMQHKPLTQPF